MGRKDTNDIIAQINKLICENSSQRKVLGDGEWLEWCKKVSEVGYLREKVGAQYGRQWGWEVGRFKKYLRHRISRTYLVTEVLEDREEQFKDDF